MSSTAPMQAASFRPFPSGSLEAQGGETAYSDTALGKFVSESAADCAPLPDLSPPGSGSLDVQADITWADRQTGAGAPDDRASNLRHRGGPARGRIVKPLGPDPTTCEASSVEHRLPLLASPQAG